MNERNELPEHFALTEEQKQELQVMINALHAKCQELEAPFLVAVCTSNSDYTVGVARATYFNGERVPDTMALAATVLKNNVQHPMQLLGMALGQ